MADNEQLRELIDRWEEAHDRGEAPSVEELCADCPHLANELRDWVVALESMEWLDESVDDESEQRESTDNEGRHLGRYRLERIIGQGGFGEVWRAYDPDLDRQVAIKIPRTDQATLQDMDAFLAEAQKVASLRHPGIVPVFDVGQADGRWFFVCELIEGANLSQRIGDGPVPPEETARIVRDIALALHYAHEHGFIHRDIKPSNILIDQSGKTYLTDFGIALAMRDFESVRTQTVGTLAYMAPEQIEDTGGVATVRTDIYGLGVVMYQMLAGQLPFQQDSPVGLRNAILSGTPTPPSTNIPTALQRICLRALARDPAKRYPSAKDLADDMDRFLVPRRRWPVRIGVGVALSLLIAGGSTWRWWQSEQDSFQATHAKTLAEAEQTADELLSHVHKSLTTTLKTPATTPGNAGSETKEDRDEPLVISRFAPSVDLSGRNLTDAHFKQLAGGLFVRRLNLSETPTTDEHLRLLQIPTLENLDLSGTQVSDAGLRHLSMLSALMHLNLANTAITDEGLKTLSPIRLRTLDLSGTKITDAGLAHLGNTHGVAGQLGDLNLSDTAITDDCIGSLKKLSRLERLDIRQTKVTASGIQAIQEALPDCTIEK